MYPRHCCESVPLNKALKSHYYISSCLIKLPDLLLVINYQANSFTMAHTQQCSGHNKQCFNPLSCFQDVCYLVG